MVCDSGVDVTLVATLGAWIPNGAIRLSAGRALARGTFGVANPLKTSTNRAAARFRFAETRSLFLLDLRSSAPLRRYSWSWWRGAHRGYLLLAYVAPSLRRRTPSRRGCNGTARPNPIKSDPSHDVLGLSGEEGRGDEQLKRLRVGN